jgi:ubiquinone/menaquinone biosynthesis C-methylase UbiE
LGKKGSKHSTPDFSFVKLYCVEQISPNYMSSSSVGKEQITAFWNADPCGTRYLQGKQDFDAHARERYRLEPFIFEFADFHSARGLKVLEIGVGMGADYVQWLKAGAQATGVDLSAASIERARQRCEAEDLRHDLRIADAEHLPFPDNSFDAVYSYGVMHHSPNTPQCIHEAWRILKPGGQARIMIYHHPSVTGAMLWLRYGIIGLKSLRQTVFDHLESPGTKSYTVAEARQLMSGFRDVNLRVEFSPGDLLLHEPSAKFRSRFYRLVWKMFPRFLIRSFGRRWGLFLVITASKPA